MRNLFSQLLDLIYKKRCYFCRSSNENTLMCKKCYEDIELLTPKLLETDVGVPVYSAAIYGGNIQKLIRGLKYHNQKELAFNQAKLMYDYWKSLDISSKKYTLVPVPLFKKRERKRKYNHMLLVAKAFGEMAGYEVNENLVKRTKDTKPQYRLTVKERQKNLQNAFKAEKELYDGSSILILDDILTTGSTLREIVEELQKNGINDVTCYTTTCTESHI